MSTILACSFLPSICRTAQQFLYSTGVNKPIATAHGGYTAIDVAERFYAAHADSRRKTSEVGDAWRLTASDLVLSNAANQPWGWASKHNLALIEYWRQIDPRSSFLLLYSSPAHALSAAVEIGAAAEEEIGTLLAAWNSYHAEMLRIYIENENDSLLINADSLVDDQHHVARLVVDRFGLEPDVDDLTPIKFSRPLPVYETLSHTLTEEDETLSSLLGELDAAADIQSRKPRDNARKRAIAAVSHLATRARPRDEIIDTGGCRDDADSSETEKINALETENRKAAQEIAVLRRQLQRAREELLAISENAPVARRQQDRPRGVNEEGRKADYYFDMRAAIDGDNWLPAGPEGRWAGPETTSTLKLPRIPEGEYTIVLGVLSAMARDIFVDMKVMANGAPLRLSQKNEKATRTGLNLLRRASRRPVTFPTELEGVLKIDEQAATEGVTLRLMFPRTVAPNSDSGAAAKKLAVRFSNISLFAKNGNN